MKFTRVRDSNGNTGMERSGMRNWNVWPDPLSVSDDMNAL